MNEQPTAPEHAATDVEATAPEVAIPQPAATQPDNIPPAPSLAPAPLAPPIEPGPPEPPVSDSPFADRAVETGTGFSPGADAGLIASHPEILAGAGFALGFGLAVAVRRLGR
ncbi:MAG: hypothetical protein ACR2HD_01605 [Solirubrobacteraceae bacterium]|nr:MAG: hypothetical protein DLM63_06390 [Solirubrobacterales bacterium]